MQNKIGLERQNKRRRRSHMLRNHPAPFSNLPAAKSAVRLLTTLA